MPTRPTVPVAVTRGSGPPTTCVDAEPYALRVTDDSMAPEFPAGCIVVVDPSVGPADGRFVVARTADGPVLRRLRAAGHGWHLEALAGEPAPCPVEPSSLLGGVTQRAGRRRRDHKHYR